MMRRTQVEWIALTLTLLGIVAGGIVWGARLEERVTANERARVAAEAHHTDTDRQILEELRYIRGRVDQLLDRGGPR